LSYLRVLLSAITTTIVASGASAPILLVVLFLWVLKFHFGSMEQLGSHWTDIHEMSTFSKPVEKILVSLKSDKNNEIFT
jgi:hypothetical protein